MNKTPYPLCAVADCGWPAVARSWCSRHYQRWRTHGNPLETKFIRARAGESMGWLLEKLGAEHDGCVEWPFGGRQANGYSYGIIKWGGRYVRVTHFVLDFSGHPRPDPPGDFALHSCDNTRCINPKHLRWGTQADNIHDAINRARLDHRAIRRLAVTPHGEGHYRAKLTDDDIRAIRAASGTQREIAARFGLDQGYVSQIRSRKRWAHVV